MITTPDPRPAPLSQTAFDDLAARLAVLQAEVDRGIRSPDNPTVVGHRLCIAELVSKWPAYVGPLPVVGDPAEVAS